MANLLNQVAHASAEQSDTPPPDHSHRQSGMSGKNEYREFCREEIAIPLFSRDWWLDATVGEDGWDVAVVKNKGEIIASMPYVLRSRYGMTAVTQPPLTPMLGPWLRPRGARAAARISHEKETMQALIDQLPAFDHFSQTWHSSVQNWQPFYWNGFKQTTFYSYVLPDLSDTGKLWDGLDTKMRRSIKTARIGYHLQVRDDLPLDDLLVLNRLTFERQGLSPPYPDAFVRRLDAACVEHGCRKLLIAVDPDGVQHAGNYIVWDEHSAYGLMTAANPALRESDASSLCMWASIEHAAGVTRQYNFWGSMIEPIERYMRNFGGTQVPYFHLSKTRSRLLRLRQGLLSLTEKK
jgi:hypothetical protein